MGTKVFLLDTSSACAKEKATYTDGNRGAGELVTDSDEELEYCVLAYREHLLSRTNSSNKRSARRICWGRGGRLACLPLPGAPFPLFAFWRHTNLMFLSFTYKLVFDSVLRMFALLVEGKRYSSYALMTVFSSALLHASGVAYVSTVPYVRCGLSDLPPMTGLCKSSPASLRLVLLSCLRILNS